MLQTTISIDYLTQKYIIIQLPFPLLGILTDFEMLQQCFW